MIAFDLSARFSDLLDRLANLGWIDWTCLGILALTFVIGLCKGLIWQTGRLSALGFAFFAAVQWGPDVGQWLAVRFGRPSFDPGPYLIGARAILFFGALFAGLALASAAARAVQKGPLKALDRIGGGAVGLAIGSALLVVAFSAALTWVPGAKSKVEHEPSYALRYSRLAVLALGDWAPPGLRRVYDIEDDPVSPAPTAVPGRALDLDEGRTAPATMPRANQIAPRNANLSRNQNR